MGPILPDWRRKVKEIKCEYISAHTSMDIKNLYLSANDNGAAYVLFLTGKKVTLLHYPGLQKGIGFRKMQLPALHRYDRSREPGRPAVRPAGFPDVARLVKLPLFLRRKIQYFYIEKRNLLFTFTCCYGTMYLVKIGNYLNISCKKGDFPLEMFR